MLTSGRKWTSVSPWFQGAYTGSELNNFVVKQGGDPAVVILDEFEKLERKAQVGFIEVGRSSLTSLTPG